MTKKSVLLALLGVCFVFLLSGCGNKDPINEDDNIKRAALITMGDETWEIRAESSSGNTEDSENSEKLKLFGYHNNEKTADFLKDYNGEPLISVSIQKETNDLKGNSLIAENVYSTTLKEAGMYLAYLENNGYTKDFEALTYKFAEYYFSNEADSITQRVIITDSYTAVTEVEYKELPEVNLQDYLFD